MPGPVALRKNVTSIVALKTAAQGGGQTIQAREMVAMREELVHADTLKTPEQIEAAIHVVLRHVAETTQAARSLPVLGGTYYPGVAFTAGVVQTIAHGVGGTASFLVCRTRVTGAGNTPVVVEVGQDANGRISLASAVSCVCDLWFYPQPGPSAVLPGLPPGLLPPFLIPAPVSTAGWKTALDLDFTIQGNQTLSADGNYTIGGMTWTKSNSALDSTATALAAGTGLTFRPVSATSYNAGAGAHRSLPAVWLPFAQIPALAGIPVDYSTKFRVWAYVSADNCAANNDAAVVAVDDNSPTGTSNFGLIMWRGFSGVAVQANMIDVNNSNPFEQDTPLASLDATNRVMLLELNQLMASELRTAVGAYSSGWPAVNALKAWARLGAWSISNLDFSAAPGNPFTGTGITLGAQRNTSATALAVTYARVRLDYHL